MIGFFIKKAFFDSWDNLITLVGLNLVYLLVLLSAYGALSALGAQPVIGIVLLLVVLLLNSLVTGTISFVTKHFAWFQRPTFADVKRAFLDSWRHSLLHYVFTVIVVVIVQLVIPFYLSYQKLLPFTVAVILFWIVLTLVMASLYYFALAAQMPADKPLKTFKKSLMVVGDNMGFTIFFLLYTVLNLVSTIVFATIIPGVSGISLSQQVAMKLLMFKYDFLEEHPNTPKKQLPWEELLFDERERVGKRTFKGMIFPWKE